MQVRGIQARRLDACEPAARFRARAEKGNGGVGQDSLPHLACADDAEPLVGMDQLQRGGDACFEDACDRLAGVLDGGELFQGSDEGVVRVTGY